MPAKSRRKGTRGELEACKLLRPAFQAVRRRGLSEEAQGTDLGRDLAGTPGWCIQVQLADRPNAERKLREAIAAAAADETALALVRRTNGSWLAVLHAEAFVRLIRAWEYAWHTPACRDHDDPARCDCGFTELVEAPEAAR